MADFVAIIRGGCFVDLRGMTRQEFAERLDRALTALTDDEDGGFRG